MIIQPTKTFISILRYYIILIKKSYCNIWNYCSPGYDASMAIPHMPSLDDETEFLAK